MVLGAKHLKSQSASLFTRAETEKYLFRLAFEVSFE